MLVRGFGVLTTASMDAHEGATRGVGGAKANEWAQRTRIVKTNVFRQCRAADLLRLYVFIVKLVIDLTALQKGTCVLLRWHFPPSIVHSASKMKSILANVALYLHTMASSPPATAEALSQSVVVIGLNAGKLKAYDMSLSALINLTSCNLLILCSSTKEIHLATEY